MKMTSQILKPRKLPLNRLSNALPRHVYHLSYHRYCSLPFLTLLLGGEMWTPACLSIIPTKPWMLGLIIYAKREIEGLCPSKSWLEGKNTSDAFGVL